jgi:hypothetical protein
MAKFTQGINGPFYGKVGTVVGYMWKGIPVMRALPTTRTKPFTPKELNQQAKFRLMNWFLRPLKDLLKVTFAHLAGQMSSFNKAFSYNIKNGISGVGADLAIDYTMVLISRGDLPKAESGAVRSPSPGILEFNWNDNSGKGKARNTDKAFVAVFEETAGQWSYQLDIATRDQGKCEINLEKFSDKKVHGFMGFLSADGKDASDSLYMGSVVA